MANRILTTHVGSLPRPQKLLDASQKRTLGQKFDEAEFEKTLKDAVIDVVRLQKEVGVDLINDGELGHTMGWAYDYGSWWSYVVRRLGGVEVANTGLWMTTLKAHTKTPMAPNDFVVGDWHDRRDMTKFQEAYMDPHSGCGLPEQFILYVGTIEPRKNLVRLLQAFALLQRNASAPRSRSTDHGSITLPRDFDIFRPSWSTMCARHTTLR